MEEGTVSGEGGFASDDDELIVDTKGACLFCLEECSNPSECEISLRFICRYLQIKPSEILLQCMKKSYDLGEEEASSLISSNQDVSVTLCSRCLSLVNTVSKLVAQLEATTMQVINKLHEMHQILNTSVESEDGGLKWGKVQEQMLATSEDRVEIRLVEQLRLIAKDKCLQKVNRDFSRYSPSVRLQRLPKESANTPGRPDSPPAPVTPPSPLSPPTPPSPVFEDTHDDDDDDDANDSDYSPPPSPPSPRSKLKISASIFQPASSKASNDPAPKKDVRQPNQKLYPSSKHRIMTIFSQNFTPAQNGKEFKCHHCPKSYLNDSAKVRDHLLNAHPEVVFASLQPPDMSNIMFLFHVKEMLTKLCDIAGKRLGTREYPRGSGTKSRPLIKFNCLWCSRMIRNQNGRTFKYHTTLEHFKELEAILRENVGGKKIEDCFGITTTHASDDDEDNAVSDLTKMSGKRLKRDNVVIAVKSLSSGDTIPTDDKYLSVLRILEAIYKETGSTHSCLHCPFESNFDVSKIRRHVVNIHPDLVFATARKLEDKSDVAFQSLCLKVLDCQSRAVQKEGKDGKKRVIWICTMCDYSNRCPTYMRWHMVIEHFTEVEKELANCPREKPKVKSKPGPKPKPGGPEKKNNYVCKTSGGGCGKRFKSNFRLQRHQMLACDQKNKNKRKKDKFVCELSEKGCGQAFATAIFLLKHKHEGCSKAKKLRCVCKCGKKFEWPSGLRRHQQDSCQMWKKRGSPKKKMEDEKNKSSKVCKTRSSKKRSDFKKGGKKIGPDFHVSRKEAIVIEEVTEEPVDMEIMGQVSTNGLRPNNFSEIAKEIVQKSAKVKDEKGGGEVEEKLKVEDVQVEKLEGMNVLMTCVTESESVVKCEDENVVEVIDINVPAADEI